MKLLLSIVVFLPIFSFAQTSLISRIKYDTESTEKYLDRKYKRVLGREYPELNALECSIHHSFLFYVDQDYLDETESRIPDIGFLNHLIPFRQHGNRVQGMSTIIFSNGDLLHGENGKLYHFDDQDSNLMEKYFFEKVDSLDIEIVFFISGLNVDLRFGLSNEGLFVLRQQNGKVESFDFAEFKSCCSDDLIVQPIVN